MVLAVEAKDAVIFWLIVSMKTVGGWNKKWKKSWQFLENAFNDRIIWSEAKEARLPFISLLILLSSKVWGERLSRLWWKHCLDSSAFRQWNFHWSNNRSNKENVGVEIKFQLKDFQAFSFTVKTRNVLTRAMSVPEVLVCILATSTHCRGRNKAGCVLLFVSACFPL